LSKRKREGVKSDSSLVEIMTELGAKHKGKCPHCGMLYEFDELERMFNQGWHCKSCPSYEDVVGMRVHPWITIDDLVDVELWNIPTELFR